MKICTKCKTEKQYEEFSKNSRSKTGLQPKCKSCNKQYYENNISKIKVKQKEHHNKNKEEINLKRREYRRLNKDKVKLAAKNFYQKNKEKVKQKSKEYVAKNRNKVLSARKKYRQAHKKERNNYLCWRRETDSLFKLTSSLRSMLNRVFSRKKYSKKSKTYTLLGADFEVVKQHLIETAIKNYGKYDPTKNYHIDHIIPCASAKTEEALIKLQHYSNLQYLTAQDNLRKRDKLEFNL